MAEQGQGNAPASQAAKEVGPEKGMVNVVAKAVGTDRGGIVKVGAKRTVPEAAVSFVWMAPADKASAAIFERLAKEREKAKANLGQTNP